MTRPITLAITVMLSCASASAAGQIYKCTDERGRVTFSQEECGDNQETLNYKVSSPAAQVSVEEEATLRSSAAPTKSESRDIYERIRKKRRVDELNRYIDHSEDKVRSYIRKMDKEIAALKNRKRWAANNLAGATWQESLSSEMEAITKKYDTLIDHENGRLDRYRREKRELQDDLRT